MSSLSSPKMSMGLVLGTAMLASQAFPQGSGDSAKTDALNMALLGHEALQNRPAYSPVIKRQGDKWFAYIGVQGGKPMMNTATGKIEPHGTLIIDVTDPTVPKFVHHIPGPENNRGTSHARVCSGAELPNAASKDKIYLVRPSGVEAQELWDVTDPTAPTLMHTLTSGLVGAHKNWWECDTGTAYLISGVKDWKTEQMMQVFDLSNPDEPKHIRDFGLPETAPDFAGETSIGGKEGIHGPISYQGRVYVAWGTNVGGKLQILDRDKLVNGNPASAERFSPTKENLEYPEISLIDMQPNWGGHTSFPLIGMDVPEFAKDTAGSRRDFVFFVSEVFKEWCQGPRHLSFVVDVTDTKSPWPVSSFQVPQASGDFCDRGGRFGPHGSNESFSPVFYNKLVFLSYFNAGVRAVDVRDPFNPREVGHFIPKVEEGSFAICSTVPERLQGKVEPNPAKPGPENGCAKVIQTNNVEVDDRGFVYIVDRAGSGLHILKLEGEARDIADYSKAVTN